VWAIAMVLLALALAVALQFIGLGPAVLSEFAPDLALVLAAAGVLLCLPAALRTWRWGGDRLRGRGVAPT
jgi:Na+/glutamate symporter